MTSKSTIGAAIARAREPGCDYPGCEGVVVWPFWERCTAKGVEVLAGVCASHSRQPARGVAAERSVRRLLGTPGIAEQLDMVETADGCWCRRRRANEEEGERK